MKIKTIVNRLDNASDFDKRVNQALEKGWNLTKREVIKPSVQSAEKYTYTMLYAELEMSAIEEEFRSKRGY